MKLLSRREILQGLSGAGLCRAGAVLASPVLLSRSEAQVTPDVVQFRPEIEPLVRLMERTPREKCAEMLAGQLHRGVSYRQLLGALFLAGIRNVNPQPPGFALHCVFVIHSAHLLSLEAPADARLLPLFYALDNFKTAQERDARQNDYVMRPLGAALPAPDRAGAELAAALEAWDAARAERAVAALARHRSPSEVFEKLWLYGARDYRNIGHKAIFVANAYRTLHAVGWQHAEPVLRSLVLGLLAFGPEQQVNGYGFNDQCYLGNVRRVRETFPKLSAKWMSDEAGPDAARSILEVLRQAAPDEACADVAGRLVKGQASAAAVWDAVHLAAAELRLRANRSAALVAIHAVTSANGLRHSYLAASDPQTRYLLLLQAAGWMVQFRKWSETRPEALRDLTITGLEPAEDEEKPDQVLTETFAAISAKPDAAASRAFRMAADVSARPAFWAAALRFTAAKADEVHYYKYLAALIEDVPLASPEWQPHLLASAVYYLKGPADPEPAPMKRAREALRALAA
jgi:hypothetical protein